MLSTARLTLFLAVQSVGAMRQYRNTHTVEDFNDTLRSIALRTCVFKTLERWPRIRDTYGCGEGRSCGDASIADFSDEHDAATKSLHRIWAVQDEMAARKDQANFINKKIGNFKDDENRTIHQEKQVLKKMGFGYTKAQKRCRKGYVEAFRECMEVNAEELGNPSVAREVVSYMDKKEYMSVRAEEGFVAPKIYFNRSRVNRQSYATNFSWNKQKEICMKAADSAKAALESAIVEQLYVGEEVDGQCMETEEKFCPEGTYAVTKRKLMTEKAGKVFTLTFAGLKALSIAVFTGAGAITGGPAGAAAGFMAGNALPVPLLVASMGSFYAGLGPRQCACFPLKCKFSEEAQSCYLAANRGDTGHNPFRNTVPIWSTKCVQHAKKQNQCELQPCAAPDFEPQLMPDLYGKVGQQQENGTTTLYNCLSSNGLPIGDIYASTTLPNGAANDAAQRVKLFGELGVTPVVDPDFTPDAADA